MPVRNQGRLFVKLGALLGACLAAAGCQNSMVRHGVSSPQGEYVASAEPSSKPWYSFLRGERHSQPGKVVSMMRPVPVGTDTVNGPAVSGWNPIQRTSAEQNEPQLMPQGQILVASPAALNVEPTLEQPEQLGAPRPTSPQPLVESPPIIHHGVPLHKMGVSAPREFDKRSYPQYVIEPPDILVIEWRQAEDQKKLGRGFVLQVPVGMDGTVNLASYGSVYVAGMTIDGAREAVTAQIARRFKDADLREVSVEVAVYNSKVYYIITDGGGYGEQVSRFLATGNETVLDALAQVGGLPSVASKKHIWLARATPGDASHPQIMPVDWIGITQRGSAGTNYQIFPGDRLYVSSDPWVRKDTWLARRLAPVQNLLGTILLGSSTVNSIQGRGVGNGAR